MWIVRAVDFGDCLPIGNVWTIKFGGFLLTAIVRKIYSGYRLLFGIARTTDLEGINSLIIGIVRTSDLEYCLLFGIAHTIDLEGGLLL